MNLLSNPHHEAAPEMIEQDTQHETEYNQHTPYEAELV
jgi:hypothetical protein